MRIAQIVPQCAKYYALWGPGSNSAKFRIRNNRKMLPGPLSQRGVAERELDLVERIKPENDSDEIPHSGF